MGNVDNIFDFENSKNPGGEFIEEGRYYIETKYKGGYNGTDADYIYLDELAGKDGIDGKDGLNGKDGENGQDGINGVDGKDGVKGDKGDKGDRGKKGDRGLRGFKGEQGKGLEDRYEFITEARLLDTKKTTWSIYAGRDFNNDVNIVGAKCVIKFGKSYEERRIEELEKRINMMVEEENEVEVVPYGNNGLQIKAKF
jgi:hypothetical protein